MPALQSIMDPSGMNVLFFARVAFIDSINQDSWARVSMLWNADIALAMLRTLTQNLETHDCDFCDRFQKLRLFIPSGAFRTKNLSCKPHMHSQPARVHMCAHLRLATLCLEVLASVLLIQTFCLPCVHLVGCKIRRPVAENIHNSPETLCVQREKCIYNYTHI